MEASIARRSKLLSNENYVAKAPEAIVNQERENLALEEAKLKAVLDRLEQIKYEVDIQLLFLCYNLFIE